MDAKTMIFIWVALILTVTILIQSGMNMERMVPAIMLNPFGMSMEITEVNIVAPHRLIHMRVTHQ